jgi:hypothetical protein
MFQEDTVVVKAAQIALSLGLTQEGRFVGWKGSTNGLDSLLA